MLVKPCAASSSLKPCTVASSAGCVTIWLMPTLNALVLSTAAALALAGGVVELLPHPAATAATSEKQHERHRDGPVTEGAEHESPFECQMSVAF